jgi:hypothetical protein
VSDAPELYAHNLHVEASATPAIAEESAPGVGVSLAMSTLDGSQPLGDDFDRVVYKVRLHTPKKAIPMLPEEVTQIYLHQAQQHVANKTAVATDSVEDIPLAVALPAFAMHDAAVEALLDAMPGTVIVQRSIAALAGALLLPPQGQSNALLDRLDQIRTELHKEYQRKLSQDANARFEDEVLVILCGMTLEGFECTAVQVSHLQKGPSCCLFGSFKVLANVSDQDNHPLSKLATCTQELEAVLHTIYPDNDGPGALVLYGTHAEQETIHKEWNQHKTTSEWNTVPVILTKAESVAMGTAVLGGVSHGRVAVLVEKGRKSVADLAIRVENVAPVAVGVEFHYFGGTDASKWTPVKTIFDFDRRVPAGPYALELKASECVVYRTNATTAASKKKMTDDEFIKATQANEGAKHIPQREEAALQLRVQVVQKWTRDGDWKPVGNPIEPLIKADGDDITRKVACESVTLELSLGVTGMITSSLVGERYVACKLVCMIIGIVSHLFTTHTESQWYKRHDRLATRPFDTTWAFC